MDDSSTLFHMLPFFPSAKVTCLSKDKLQQEPEEHMAGFLRVSFELSLAHSRCYRAPAAWPVPGETPGEVWKGTSYSITLAAETFSELSRM